jgi:DNA-binding response OmpR family regulator
LNHNTLDQIKIIVQEADTTIRDILQYVLEEADYEVLAVADSSKLVELIDTFKPNVVMLDYIVSGRLSIETCAKVKLLFPGLPVLALSCNPRIHEVYADGGFDDFITKPFEIDELLAVLAIYSNASKATSRTLVFSN